MTTQGIFYIFSHLFFLYSFRLSLRHLQSFCYLSFEALLNIRSPDHLSIIVIVNIIVIVVWQFLRLPKNKMAAKVVLGKTLTAFVVFLLYCCCGLRICDTRRALSFIFLRLFFGQILNISLVFYGICHLSCVFYYC